MKSSIFRDIMPCSLLKVNGRSGGKCLLHNLQGRRITQARDQHETDIKQSSASYLIHVGFCYLLLASFFFGLYFDPEDGSETSDDFQRTTRRYIPGDRTPQGIGSYSIQNTSTFRTTCNGKSFN
jgi:hypothetical protein